MKALEFSSRLKAAGVMHTAISPNEPEILVRRGEFGPLHAIKAVKVTSGKIIIQI